MGVVSLLFRSFEYVALSIFAFDVVDFSFSTILLTSNLSLTSNVLISLGLFLSFLISRTVLSSAIRSTGVSNFFCCGDRRIEYPFTGDSRRSRTIASVMTKDLKNRKDCKLLSRAYVPSEVYTLCILIKTLFIKKTA